MGDGQWVSASELAEFVYCPEAWRLSSLGHESVNRDSMEQGTGHHTRKAVSERVAGFAIGVGRLLISLAFLALAIWAMLSR